MRVVINYYLVLIGLAILIIWIGLSSCQKKKSGFCYCTYLSGDKKDFNLNHLDRQQQQDTCAQISQNASHFAGSCKLK